ncbi:carbohydrate ABC transporter permease [Nocardioides sp. Kera G14]|uniref:carbohydrate ABC transporter permease n=1 Tax=Nocardioides sp. Kera G14 TaxID=2884264 RepID=UPI001D122B79|nr:carbohydrate ABC transporter permease [Nocardioides sp. Kera G14]UDY24622.1 carbohydrate ABC transporter permease [Nocardioides sp. Kera G14]
MTSTPLTQAVVAPEPTPKAGAAARKALSNPWASLAAFVIAVFWTIPTAGLLISSFRPENEVKSTGWWHFFSSPHLTLDNYKSVLSGSGDASLGPFVINSIAITLPAVIIPIFLATMAAYAFAWMDFKGKNILFVAIFALQIVPLQVTLVPLLKLYGNLGLQGQDAPAGGFYSLWLSHTMFALPLAIFLLHNFMREIPGELIESARIDGATHPQIFLRLILPLMTPAIAAFGILQFLWVWNDLLVSLVFGGYQIYPINAQLAALAGTRGSAWHLLSAGAFVSLIIPLVVFLALQRFFVRGLLAGSVKG